MPSVTRTLTAGVCCLIMLWAGCDAGGPAVTVAPEAPPPGTFTLDVSGERNLALTGTASFRVRQPPSPSFEPRLEVSLTDRAFGTVEFDHWRADTPPPGTYLICNVPACAGEEEVEGSFVPLFLHADPYRWASGQLDITESSADHLAGRFEFITLSARENGEALSTFTGAFHAVRAGD